MTVWCLGLRGLSVGHRSNARNEAKSQRQKKQTQKTLMLLCGVCKPSGAVSVVKKGSWERGERQIKNQEKG